MTTPIYGHDTTSEQVCEHLASNIKGRTILITGPTRTGIGYGTALAIAGQQPGTLILAGRPKRRGLIESRDEILSHHPDCHLRLLIADLALLESVRRAAEQVFSWGIDIDVFIANAGVMDTPYSLTNDGFETQLASNYLGHALLIHRLLPRILASHSKRIVLVSSSGHENGGIRWDDPNFKDGYNRKQGYGQSKTALILLGRELAKRFGQQGLIALSLDPGGIATPLQKHWDLTERIHVGDMSGGAWDEQGNVDPNWHGWKNLSQGGSTTCRAAFDNSLDNHNGAYMTDCNIDEDRCKEHAKDKAQAERLWPWTLNLLGENGKA